MNRHCFLLIGLILNGLMSPLLAGVAGRGKAPLTFDNHIVPLLFPQSISVAAGFAITGLCLLLFSAAGNGAPPQTRRG
jgi:hypothetical protein